MKSTNLKSFFEVKPKEEPDFSSLPPIDLAFSAHNSSQDEQELYFEQPSVNLLSFYSMAKERPSNTDNGRAHDFQSKIPEKESFFASRVEPGPVEKSPYDNSAFFYQPQLGTRSELYNQHRSFFESIPSLEKNKKRVKESTLDSFVVKQRLINSSKM